MNAFITIGFLFFQALSPAPDTPIHEWSVKGRAQGTTYSLKYYFDKEIPQKEIDSVLHIIDLSMSVYQNNSLISRFNNGSGLAIDMDPHMKNVVTKSFEVNKLSKGYFDITVFPLVSLWGFGPHGFSKVPSQQAVDSVLQFVGMDKLYMQGNTLYKTDPRVQIDVNGIAQGYTVDCLAQFLSNKGVQNYLVELGGEIRVKGRKPDGYFQVMVDEQNDVDKAYTYPILSIENRAVTTSSVREKQYKAEGKMVSHHINPVSGRPITSPTISVTVIADNAMLADALDNYFMSLAPAEAIRIAEKMPSVELCLYYVENEQRKVLHTSGFNNYIYGKSNKPYTE
ncbi:FAD:protein FMN transferase [Sphingobacterium sp. SGG-5]|uniref:FAD:protein FMN transferase n=1 Tax=Sphingobacterium sp. SGG-5 TaxID=2710881 RepID=UPI0013ED4E69|nr:FAD:protein FMN transferase [Sphingobacterium sp. SGG-5]NGM61940.1 FAD:protein FMN transferase [Sphingobacterium sp. SGG-5]